MGKRKPPESDRTEPEPLPDPKAEPLPDVMPGHGQAVVQRLGPEVVPVLRR
jgi:hypothetical protein